MNTRRFFLAFVAAFIFIFCWGWLYNGVLVANAHGEVMNLFRPREETMGLFYWIVIGQAIIALAFVLIYASGFAGGGIGAGIRLGIMLELLAIGARMMIYAVQPFTAKLIVLWSVGGLIEMIVTGAIVGGIYGSGKNQAE
ncbi:MAG: hypothetical protein ACREIF_02930 [Chthoniobacterales bacterium]